MKNLKKSSETCDINYGCLSPMVIPYALRLHMAHAAFLLECQFSHCLHNTRNSSNNNNNTVLHIWLMFGKPLVSLSAQKKVHCSVTVNRPVSKYIHKKYAYS